MPLRASGSRLFDCPMLRLSSKATLIGESGPVPISELSVGDKVLCMAQGSPQFVVADHVSQSAPASAVRLCTDAGDLLTARDTAVVTSAGLRQAGELADLRDTRAIGRMQGSWPLLEVLSVVLPMRGKSKAADLAKAGSDCRSRLMSLSQIPGGQSEVFRVGSHTKRVIDRFQDSVIGESCAIEPGPAGWSWLSPKRPPRSTPSRDLDPTSMVDCALALWQPILEEQAYRLPVEMEELRSYTFTLLHYLGVPFETSFRPRYLPMHVELRLKPRETPHAAVQAVLSVTMNNLVQLTLKARGCYLIASGLLCSQ